eukprot:705505_1
MWCALALLFVATSSSRRERPITDTGYVVLDQAEYILNRNDPTPDNDLECNVRLMAYEYALSIQSYRGATQPLTYQALQIDTYCNSTNVNSRTNPKYVRYRNALMKHKIRQHSVNKIIDDATVYTVYVDPNHGNDDVNNGSIHSPFLSLQRALQSTRSFKSNPRNKQIVIRSGTLFLNETITLSPTTFDNNLQIIGYPTEDVWISGGARINDLKWTKYNDGNASHNIWMTPLDPSFVSQLFNHTIYSLFTENPHKRLVRARFPNGNLEVFRQNNMFISATNTIEWFVPYGQPPKQIFKNLSCSLPSNDGICLNKSAQTYYNHYTAGYDNICDIWNTENFWCGNYTSGGWAFEDKFMSTAGRRQLPVGMRYNKSNAIGARISSWKSNISEQGLVFVLHDQGWCMTMNRISSVDGVDLLHSGNISFEFGGFQGANVNRLSTKDAINNQPIQAGSYYFDGIFDELDTFGEFYFNKTTHVLYLYPNDTHAAPNMQNTGNLIIGNLSTLFRLHSPSHLNPLWNVRLSNLQFRDTRYTFMDRWGVPSGGGWALYNGGAIYLTNTTNCSVENSYFDRLDGNAIMLYGFNRNTTLKRNEFTMIGDNVMAGWGYTHHDDGTSGLQPRFTYIIENYVHEIGLYQLQSSAWFQAKTCQSFIHRNIVFNVPRAAINFNDGFGGANEASQNLLFNTCTESGDHGPINSWDRMPFLTNVSYGYPSYDTAYSNVHSNFIFANYGSSQAFDTDDGSAWYNIYNNFGWNAQGYKNDYGGYNVNFYNNLNVVWGNKAGNEACWNIEQTHYHGPSNKVYNNKCIVYSNRGTIITVRAPTSYKGSSLVMTNNSYFSVYGNVTWQMTNHNGGLDIYDLSQVQTILGFEANSSVDTIPKNKQILQWAKEVLHL